jgi:hypothetical protein
MSHRIAVALVLVALSAAAEASGPRLKLPSFAHLESQAVESTDITLGWLPLRFAGWFIDEDDPRSAQAHQMLRSVKSVSVRHYEFGSDFVYSTHDLDTVRAQLSGNGWSQVVQVRDRRKDEDVDVFLCLDGEKITGIAIVASQPRQFTIVNIVGSLDMEQVERWADHVGSGGDHRWASRVEKEDAGAGRLEDENPADAGFPEL